jgi:hypothetical protein
MLFMLRTYKVVVYGYGNGTMDFAGLELGLMAPLMIYFYSK